mmetsp:Transcript_8680/g.8800  ORF Transcript_8680/g.8800 Transcript_8680/m.8800 type:complete len:133 (-) Transcript_8680:121-519(-)|eukprot:CAMPEP_0182433216 /NCGR_PEP_ID=MMETSP1167-20130531/61695_1 /TAXON_ID=2988 /ORGANISM="Mallomonas Sp, Strain CCMP3275" /LENGTH=132 /DNA_ID=CAMNT_0024621633 /DNA_START=192 /DNA_END=590 /DNA_ORIENTATION=+
MTTQPLSYNGEKLMILSDNSVGIGGDKWPAAELFCDFLSNSVWRDYFSSLLANKRCIELGAGNGLVGIFVDKLFDPKEMIITDLATHVSHISHNVLLNRSARVQVLELDWTDAEACPTVSRGGFDIIFALEW